jgi:hypothetical protein
MKTLYILALVGILILYLILQYSKETYPGIQPRACEILSEYGASPETVMACAEYSLRCDDQTSQNTPIVASKVAQLFDEGDGNLLNQRDLIRHFTTGKCVKPLSCADGGSCPPYLECGHDSQGANSVCQ